MLALGSVKTIITENVKNGRIQFDMHGFLAGVILADLNLAGGLRACVGQSNPPPLPSLLFTSAFCCGLV